MPGARARRPVPGARARHHTTGPSEPERRRVRQRAAGTGRPGPADCPARGVRDGRGTVTGPARLPPPVPGLGPAEPVSGAPSSLSPPVLGPAEHCRAPGNARWWYPLVTPAGVLFPQATREDAVVRPPAVRVPGVLCGGQHGREGRHRGPPAGVQVSCLCPAHRHGPALGWFRAPGGLCERTAPVASALS